MPKPVIPIVPGQPPYMLETSVALLDDIIKPHFRVFEFGSGGSTVWLAHRAARIVAVEHDAEWAAETERALREAGKWSKVELVLVDHEDRISEGIANRGEFDLILVDCLDRQRNKAVRAAMPHLAPGGVLVLDDWQWSMLRPSRKLLKKTGWNSAVMKGHFTRYNGEVKPHETGFWFKPAINGDEEE